MKNAFYFISKAKSCFKRTNFIVAKWNNRCLQGSVLGPLLFLIYINNLTNEILSSWKIFAEDTSLFSKIENKSYSNFQLNKDLETISKWAFQWKMLLNPDPVKQAVEVCFSHKPDKAVYPPL